MATINLPAPAGLLAGVRHRPFRPGRPLSSARRLALGAIGVLVLLGVWELVARLEIVNPYLSSSPSLIVQRAVVLIGNGDLAAAGLSTLNLYAIGMLISIGIGTTLGVALGWFRTVRALLDPLVSVLYAAPRIAFIPLIIVWVGAGIRTQIVMVVLNAVFPIIVSTMAGISNYDRQLASVSRSFGGGNLWVLRTIALPGAVPFLLAGLRQGMMAGLLGTVVAEYFIGVTGIGGMIFNAGLVLDTSTVFVGALTFSLAAIVLTGLLNLVSARVSKWREE